MAHGLLPGLLLGGLLALNGCVGKRIVIVDPDDGLLPLGTVDDRDSRVAGLQYDVVVDTVDFGIGDAVTVYVGDDPATLVDSGVGYEGSVEPNRRATVRATLPDGDVYLVACAGTDCAHRSTPRHLVVQGSVGSCPLIQFTAPRSAGTGPLVLAAADDAATDDGTCGAKYATPVTALVQVPDGTRATLFVDGLPFATESVTGNRVDFGDVPLGVRGDDTSTLRITVEGQPTRCSEDHPRPIAVACAGPTCRLVPPTTGAYLNATLDVDATSPGLEIATSATAPVGAVGETFTMLVDGVSVATADAAVVGGLATARFARVPISTASTPSYLQAICSAGALTTRSTRAMYRVDVTPCSTAILAPAANAVFLGTDDLDRDLSNGMQIATTTQLIGADCSGYRIAACGALTSTPLTAITGNAGGTVQRANVTIGTSGTQEICAEGVDVAGNVAQYRVTVGVAPDGPPRVAVVGPAAATRINRKGGLFAGADYRADANPATAICDVDVDVDCSGIGTAVALVVDGATSGVTATCVADAASTLGGRATLRSVPLPASTTMHTLVARQSVSAVTGSSTPIGIEADCIPPTLSIASPLCGSFVDASDDVSTNPGVQTSVVVASPNTPQVDVTLTLARASGTSTVATSLASMLSPGATSHTYSALDFGTSGVARLVATALDPFGNAAVTPTCSVTVARSPFIVLTPLPTSTFDASNLATYDCRPSTAGLDLRIAGTTSAGAGSIVTVQIGSAAAAVTTVNGGAYAACVPAPNGASSVFVSVTDTNGIDGVSGTASAAPLNVTVNGVGQ